MYAFNPKINRNKEPMESGRTGLKIPTRLMTIPAYGLVPTKSKGHILCYITEIKQNKCQVAHHIPLPRDRHEANQVLKECTYGRSDCFHCSVPFPHPLPPYPSFACARRSLRARGTGKD